jgi:hypothetical protein
VSLYIPNTCEQLHVIQSIIIVVCIGGNLTVEMIYRSLLLAAKEKGMKRIRNVYIQMDNASPNKCFTVIAAMAALCLLGVVKKVPIDDWHGQTAYLSYTSG